MSFLIFALMFSMVSGIIHDGHSSNSSSEEHSYGGGKRHDHGGGHHHGGHNHGSQNGCPPGWIRSERPSGGWCIKVFAGAFIRDAADLKCREQGAVLSGLKDSAEIEKITDSARLIFSPNPINILWIGAKRIARCLRAPPSTGCNWSNAFEWTDGVTTGREGFIWNTGQPDNRGLRQGCSTLMVLMGPTIRTYNLFYNGRLDDNDCPYPVNGYVCGKHAIRN